MKGKINVKLNFFKAAKVYVDISAGYSKCFLSFKYFTVKDIRKGTVLQSTTKLRKS
jgi:hypothetical protein